MNADRLENMLFRNAVTATESSCQITLVLKSAYQLVFNISVMTL